MANTEDVVDTTSPEADGPTPLTDPEAYLALFKFNSRLPKCPRTGIPVSYADIGDPTGTPVLFMPPSGCSRWFAAPQDPLAAGHNIRLIVLDRPGCGATPMVPLSDRIETSCQQIVSVLEHLGVKPAHMIATSAGIYVALRLLSKYPSIFLTGLAPPPALYLISPWSPPLPSTDPLAYRQMLDWVPSGLITTQDTTIPYVLSAVRGAEDAYDVTTKAVGGAVSAVKGWFGSWTAAPPAGEPVSAPVIPEEKEKLVPTPPPEEEHENSSEEQPKRKRLWAPSAKYLTMEYLYAEDFRGIGQEHMLCLNRGEMDTGPEWFQTETAAVASEVRKAQSGARDGKLEKLPIDVWWGGQDGMVPRNGQTWLNKTLASHRGEIAFVSHFVEDGDHSNLTVRAAGIGEVYLTIMSIGNTTMRRPQAVGLETELGHGPAPASDLPDLEDEVQLAGA